MVILTYRFYSYCYFWFLFILLYNLSCYGQLPSGKSGLKIVSVPDSVFILWDNDTVGVTPLSADSIRHGTYRLTFSKPTYHNKSKELNITENTTYNLNIKLVSKKRTQIFRRISFGLLGVAFTGLSVSAIAEANTAKNKQEAAWDDYMQLNLNPDEYDSLYKVYKKRVRDTNRRINIRNGYLSIVGLSLVGFTLSIPF